MSLDVHQDLSVSTHLAANGGKAQLFVTRSRVCTRCDGRVRGECGRCSGTGRTSESKLLNVNVTAGTRHGQVLRLRGQGHDGGPGSTAGDLYVHVLLVADPHPGSATGWSSGEPPAPVPGGGSSSNVKAWLGGGGLVICAITLFVVLQNNRNPTENQPFDYSRMARQQAPTVPAMPASDEWRSTGGALRSSSEPTGDLTEADLQGLVPSADEVEEGLQLLEDLKRANDNLKRDSCYQMLVSAAESCQALCDEGDPKACMLLGISYSTGNGVALDRSRAFQLISQACDLQYREACEMLATARRVDGGAAADASSKDHTSPSPNDASAPTNGGKAVLAARYLHCVDGAVRERLTYSPDEADISGVVPNDSSLPFDSTVHEGMVVNAFFGAFAGYDIENDVAFKGRVAAVNRFGAKRVQGFGVAFPAVDLAPGTCPAPKAVWFCDNRTGCGPNEKTE